MEYPSKFQARSRTKMSPPVHLKQQPKWKREILSALITTECESKPHCSKRCACGVCVSRWFCHECYWILVHPDISIMCYGNDHFTRGDHLRRRQWSSLQVSSMAIFLSIYSCISCRPGSENTWDVGRYQWGKTYIFAPSTLQWILKNSILNIRITEWSKTHKQNIIAWTWNCISLGDEYDKMLV